MNQEELSENIEISETIPAESIQFQPKKESECCSFIGSKWCYIASFCVLLAAIIVLYILHFMTPKPMVYTPKVIDTTPGSGEIVFVNLDTINENYELVKILTGDIQSEMTKQEAIFKNKENTFQRKYNQFQENMNSGVLTQVQAEYAQQQLMDEYKQLEEDKERVFDHLQSRQSAALLQIYDSLQAVVQRINMERNASFIITYQSQTPFILLADPTKDITDHVLFELNRFYKK